MTIVVGYRADRFGEAALNAGIVRARRSGEPLCVVNVSSGPEPADSLSDSEVQDLEGRLADSGAHASVVRLAGPDVAEELLALIAAGEASSLIIGIRHRTAVGKMLLGSVAHRLLIDCPVEVLSVKPE